MDPQPPHQLTSAAPTEALNAATSGLSGAMSVDVALGATPPTVFDPLLATPSPDKQPVSIPGYDIRGILGRGGMGVVYKARHLALNRTVALKVVLHGDHTSDADRQRFAQEAKAVARLNHPNIVQVFEVGEHEGHTYLAMEYVECGTLFSWQNRKPIAPRVATELVKTLAKAMQHAHELGIIHRDLKPANILLSGERSAVSDEPNPNPESPLTAHRSPLITPKITDFGLAKLLDTPIDLTAPGITCGTPTYMSPEQIRNNKDAVDPRTDVYSLGAILYELLTGYPVFHGDGAQEIFDQALNTQPTRPRALRSDIPRDLETICLKCLEKDRRNRYGTAAALAEDLSRFLSGLPILARPVGRVERTWRWCRRHPGSAIALAVTSVALCVTTALSVLLWRAEGRAVAAKEAEAREADRLEEALGLLQAKHNALALAKHREEAAHDRAEENLRIARDATRATLMELTREPLLQEPKFLDVRKRLLDKAKPSFDVFLIQTSDNPSVIAEQAEVCRMVAALRASVGDTVLAAEQYEQSIGFYRQLVGLRPTDPVPLIAQADVQLMYSFLQRETGRSDHGDRLLEATITLLTDAAPRFPGNTDLLYSLTRARLASIHRLSSSERIRAAASHTQAATDGVAELVRKLGATDRTEYLLSRLHHQSARIAAEAQREAEADGHFRAGLAILERVVSKGPRDLSRRGELAGLLLDYADHLTKTNRLAEAKTQLQEALKRLDAVLVESPRAVRFLILWTRGTVALGVVEAATGNDSLALDCYNRAAEQWLPVLDQHPEWVLGRLAARDLLNQRAALYEKLGKTALAVADRARHNRICPP